MRHSFQVTPLPQLVPEDVVLSASTRGWSPLIDNSLPFVHHAPVRRRIGLRFLVVTAAVLTLVGAALTAFFLYTERFTFDVLCTDPEDFACSGHYVYGVPNEVWSIGTALVGAALLATSIALRRRFSAPLPLPS